jgi:hypothetical protein
MHILTGKQAQGSAQLADGMPRAVLLYGVLILLNFRGLDERSAMPRTAAALGEPDGGCR